LKVKKSHQEGGSAFDIGDLVYDAEQVLENLGRYSNLMCFHTSPIKHQRSYIVSSNKPTLILKAITNKGAIVLCTSATLKDRAYKRGAEDTFQHFASSLGVNEKEINVTVSIEPKNFGKTQYVLADKSAPVPFIKNGNDADLNHSWIKYVISTIKCATSSGDKLLVLASSYKEVRALESAWGSSKGATFHTEGGVTESFNRFMKSKDKCLVTPAGWSGFNFRTDTKQVFAGVMVTKVPFLPPSEIAVIRKAYELTGDVVLNTQNIPLARKYVYRSSLEATIAKLIQGFGRLIRNPNDVGTIWVADPRFPHAQDTKHIDLRNAVPDRFKSQFETHQVISVNGQLNENTQPKIDEMVGFI
jgi:Rad3-related DNA helicase